MRFYAHYDVDNGCYYHRLLLPYRHLAADFPRHQFHLSLNRDPAGRYDAYTLHGLLNHRNYPEIGRWKAHGGVFVWSVDDSFPDVPEWNPARPGPVELGSWYVARDAADLVVASTPALAARIDRPAKTVVAPNLLDVAVYRITDPVPDEDGVVRFLWAGSETHAGDLDLVVGPVSRAIRKWGPGRVEFVFFGYCPEDLLRDFLHRGVHYQPGVPLSVYPQYVTAVRPAAVLAPLAPIPFNAAKSNIRVLEAWATAAAVVASPVGEYRVVRPGEDGLLAADEAAWDEHIDRLIADAPYRRTLAAAGRRRVAAEFDWAAPAARAAWHPLVGRLEALGPPAG